MDRLIARILPITLVIIAIMIVGAVAYEFSAVDPQEIVVPFQTVFKGPGGLDTRGILTINDGATWANVWNRALCGDVNGCRSSPVPIINFTSNTIIAVFTGTVPSAGYPVNITRVGYIGNRLVVDSIFWYPANCHVIQTLYVFAHIVTIPKTQLTAEINAQSKALNC